MQNTQSTLWYSKTVEEVFSLLETDTEKGLDDSQALARLKEFGPNKLPEIKKKNAFIKFIKHFHDVLIYILLCSAVVAFFMGHYIDMAVIAAVVIINALIGFIQENKAEEAMSGLRNILALRAKVLRNGTAQEVKAEQLTVGDIVYLKPGDKVPADMRLVRQANLRVEESMLTGEAVSAEKSLEPLEANTMLGDRRNMVFSGTAVSAGTAVGVVTAIGDNTEVGKINKMLSEVEPLVTPLLRQIATFSKAIAAIVLVVCSAVFIYAWQVQGHALGSLLLSVIAIAVAAIPEGLPAIMSIILAIGVQSMAKRNAIVRNLPAVETLGSVSVICSDKTGTMTKNEMTVEALKTYNASFVVSGSGYNPQGTITFNDAPVNWSAQPDLQELLTSFYLCNEASVTQTESGQWVAVGEPTEGALHVVWRKSGLAAPEKTRRDVIPFDSKYKYMAVLVEGEKENIIYIKGAPEKIAAMAFAQGSGEAAEKNAYWAEQVSMLAKKGMRTIAGACKKVDKDKLTITHDDLLEDVVFIGLAGIIDPPREEAVSAIAQCTQAGIQVKMITGDHVETARSIGVQLGISDGTVAMEGKDIDTLSDKELENAACACHIFARTSPEHKLRLVRALQAQGVVCAMTGDGVNDAPALRMANIGVAMGIKGTEVTKEASAIILADDNFQTIASAVEEGRKVYDNLRKTLLFILPTNLAQGTLILVSMLMGSMLVLTPVQVLWVNMITAVTISLVFAFEPIEADAMLRPPRSASEPLLPPYFIFRITYVGLLIAGSCLWLANILMDTASLPPELFRTIILQTMVACEAVYMFNTRNIFRPALSTSFFSNKAAFVILSIMAIIQLMVTYLPIMNTILGTAPMSLTQWALPFSVAVSLFVLVEIEKAIAHRYFEGQSTGANHKRLCG